MAPNPSIMNIERRHGHNKPVIRKAIVELEQSQVACRALRYDDPSPEWRHPAVVSRGGSSLRERH